MNDHNIKILRLQSGVDIICELEQYEEESVVRMINPMYLIFKRSESGIVLAVTPWLPVELIEENISTINYSDVLTIIEPKEKLIDYYKDMVNIHLVEWMRNAEDIFSDYFQSSVEDSFDEDTTDSEEVQYLKSNNLLH